jgi:hypothetical protein
MFIKDDDFEEIATETNHFYFDYSSGLGHVIFLLIYFRFGSHIVKDFEVP